MIFDSKELSSSRARFCDGVSRVGAEGVLTASGAAFVSGSTGGGTFSGGLGEPQGAGELALTVDLAIKK